VSSRCRCRMTALMDDVSMTADSRQQTADSRQQTADSRQQTADSRRGVLFNYFCTKFDELPETVFTARMLTVVTVSKLR
jgi:hypothetical protein